MSEVNANIKKVNEVLIDKIQIPYYQRPYRWSEKNVLLLLEDIFSSYKNLKSAYRIGSVILNPEETKDGKVLHIVDGQQRITTLVLILINLNAKEKIELANGLQYRHSDSVKNIRTNAAFIKGWIQENIGEEREDFLKYINNHCEFVEIIVGNISEAFQMFDSQNTRGKSLEAYNLLKAYHIRAMEGNTSEEKIECDRRWEDATRYAKDSLDKEKPKDVLKQIFNEQLYRSRIWCNKKSAFRFNSDKIDEFKGITINNKASVKHPYQNIEMLRAVALNYFNALNVQVKGVKGRFINKELENISPFALMNQPIINGKDFFDYIETYVEIYKQLFLESEDTFLNDFKVFYKKQCNYPNSSRTGDQYLKELYKSLIMFMFDKFGEEGVNKHYRLLYAIVYRVRLEKHQVRYRTVAKYPKEKRLFAIIAESKNYFDLRKLHSLALEEVECQRDEAVIIKELMTQNIPLKSVNSKLNLNKYKSKEYASS